MRTRTDKFEMNFANGQMIFKPMEDEIPDDNFSGGGGMMIRTFGGPRGALPAQRVNASWSK